MSGNDLFWFCAGAVLAFGLAFVIPALWRRLANAREVIRYGVVGGVAFGLTVLGLSLHAMLGGAAASTNAHPNPHAELMFPGNQLASASAPASMPAAGSSYQERVARNPGDGQSWLALAQIARSERRFPAAKDAYEKAIPLHVMTADSWADYADVLAAVSGSLRSDSAGPIAKALATDPQHKKALWLHASLALEEQRYPDALTAWKRLRAVIADDSPDARIVDANIAEAEQLLRGAATSVAATRGQVDPHAALKARVGAGS